MEEIKKKRWKSLALFLAVPLAVGGLTALLTRKSMDVYKIIKLPPLAPPGWLFPVVWVILYSIMGYSSWLCRFAPPKKRTPAFLLYAAQLALNFVWPLVFFNGQAWFLALVILAALLGTVLVMVAVFSSINKKAALLQIPYCLWLSFALYLNFMIWLRN